MAVMCTCGCGCGFDVYMWLCFQTHKTLEDYVLFIRGDPEKQSNLPKDGTVHELTSSVSCSDNAHMWWTLCVFVCVYVCTCVRVCVLWCLDDVVY